MAAVTITQRGANSTTPGTGSGTTVAVTPTAGGAGHMYLCAIGCVYNGGGGVSTLTGGGLTWTKVRDNASSTSMVSIWKATGTLTTATITATFMGANAYTRHIAVFEVIGTTTIGQQVYSAVSPTGASSFGISLSEFGHPDNRPFAAASSGNFSGGTSSILLGGGYTELHFFNGWDSSLEAGAGAYFGWVTGWDVNGQDLDPYAYDQSGYGSQYIAITALELGTPWAISPGHSTVLASDTIRHYGGNGGRSIDYCQNGNLWTVLRDTSAAEAVWRFYYSTDDGGSWTQSTSSVVGVGDGLYVGSA